MKRAYHYVVYVSPWGNVYMTVSHDSLIENAAVLAEFGDYQEASEFEVWFNEMVDA